MAQEKPTQIPAQTQELLYAEATTHSWLVTRTAAARPAPEAAASAVRQIGRAHV